MRASTAEPPLVIERGEGRQRLLLPRDEELTFDVSLELGALGSPKIGRVTITSRVTPFHPEGLLLRGKRESAALEQALISAHAVGSYAVYSADQTISTRVLPQSWPTFLHRNEQSGTENRRRELLIGVRDDKWTSQRRSDGHCKGCKDRAHFVEPTWIWQDDYHCKKCRRAEHRVWREPEHMDVPEASVDMVTAMMLARSMVLEKHSAAKFTLVDKDKLWEVEISLGSRARRAVKAGEFDAVEVKLVTRPPPGETGRDEDFEGLFGLHGTISIWMHADTGVPVEVRGSVPAGPLELDVAIELAKFRGTPAAFAAGKQ